MKVRFNRQETADVLAAVCGVALTRTPKDILKCVRVEAQSDVLLFSATDLELGLRCAVTQVEVEEPGGTLVVADTLGKIVHECDDEVLAIETTDNLLHVRGTGSHFQIVTQDETEFPPIPQMEGEPDFTLEYNALRRLVELTSFAAARESSRYAINGVLWSVEEGKLTLAATDGRRLALAHMALLEGAGRDMPQVIVPGKAMSLLGRMPVEPDVRVGVRITANQLLVDLGRSIISTALVEGQFPKYQDVIPADCDRVAVLGTAELHSALKRAALLTNEESKGVRFTFADGTLTLSSRAPEQGEATVALPVRFEGETLEIGFNPVFLLDVLRVAHTDEITINLKEANRPGVVRLGEDFVYVVMPVNLLSA